MPPDAPGTLVAPQPVPPERQYSFTDQQVNNPGGQPPGDKLDGEYDRTNQTISDTIAWAATSLNTDGSLKPHVVGESQLVPGLLDDIGIEAVALLQPMVEQTGNYATEALNAVLASNAGATLSGRHATQAGSFADEARKIADTLQAAAKGAEDDARSTSSDADRAENAANHADGSEAVAQAYADVGMAWAEHMPDIIPPNILAVQAVTGDHWSARWWANRAAVYAGGGVPGGAAVGTTPDSGVYEPLWWDSESGQLFVRYDDGTSVQWVSANNTSTDGLVPEAPMDGEYYARRNAFWEVVVGGLGVPEAPVDGGYYSRRNEAWIVDPASVGAPFLPLAGGNVTGRLTLSGGVGGITMEISATAVVGLDFTGSTISGSALRLNPLQPINFSGTGAANLYFDNVTAPTGWKFGGGAPGAFTPVITLANTGDIYGKDFHIGADYSVLSYIPTGIPRLSYLNRGSERWAILDDGTMYFGAMPKQAVDDTAAGFAGVIVNGVYLNGSVMMIRRA